MILGIGSDIIEINRIKKLINNERFLNKVFTRLEIDYCLKKAASAESFSVRFAAKEAFAKACGKGIGDFVNWHDIEIFNDELGKPSITLSKRFVDTHKFNCKVHVSLSHSNQNAIAFVIIEEL